MAKSKVTVEAGVISGTAEDLTAFMKNAAAKFGNDKNGDDNEDEEVKPIAIISATIKEGQCNYGVEIKTGPCAGDKIPSRKGANVVHFDMLQAFKALNVHLAIIDDVFKYSIGEADSLQQLINNDLTEIFTVSGFKVQGNDENEGYVLIGEKWVTHGSIGLETPKISDSSNYKFYEELKAAVELARMEVELYMNGKAAPKDDQPELPFPDPKDEGEFDKPMQ